MWGKLIGVGCEGKRYRAVANEKVFFLNEYCLAPMRCCNRRRGRANVPSEFPPKSFSKKSFFPHISKWMDSEEFCSATNRTRVHKLIFNPLIDWLLFPTFECPLNVFWCISNPASKSTRKGKWSIFSVIANFFSSFYYKGSVWQSARLLILWSRVRAPRRVVFGIYFFPLRVYFFLSRGSSIGRAFDCRFKTIIKWSLVRFRLSRVYQKNKNASKNLYSKFLFFSI